MATSENHKELTGEADGKNMVLPAGTEKSKKISFFGKLGKKKGKKEYKKEHNTDKSTKNEEKNKVEDVSKKETKKEKKEHKKDKEEKISKSKHDSDEKKTSGDDTSQEVKTENKKEIKKERKKNDKEDKKSKSESENNMGEVLADSSKGLHVASSLAAVEADQSLEKRHKKKFKLFKRGKKQAKSSDEATHNETSPQAPSTDEHAIGFAKKVNVHKRQKSNGAWSPEKATADLNGSRELYDYRTIPKSTPALNKTEDKRENLAQIAKEVQPEDENSEVKNSEEIRTSDVQTPETEDHQVEKPSDVISDTGKSTDSPKKMQSSTSTVKEIAEPILEDVITSQDEKAVKMSPEVQTYDNKDDDTLEQKIENITAGDDQAMTIRQEDFHIPVGDESKIKLPGTDYRQSEDEEVTENAENESNLNEPGTLQQEQESREEKPSTEKTKERESIESQEPGVDNPQGDIESSKPKNESLEHHDSPGHGEGNNPEQEVDQPEVRKEIGKPEAKQSDTLSGKETEETKANPQKGLEHNYLNLTRQSENGLVMKVPNGQKDSFEKSLEKSIERSIILTKRRTISELKTHCCVIL